MRRTVSYFALIAFFAALCAYLVIYVDSSMAEALVGKVGILPLFSIAAGISLFLFFISPRLLSRMGNSLFFTYLSTLQAISLLMLAFNINTPLSIAALILHIALMSPLGYSLDLFFEKVTADTTAGGVRGTLLTAGNSALVLSPLIVGAILETRSLQFLYGVCFFVFCVFFITCITMLERFKDPVYTPISLKGVRIALLGTLGPVIASQFVLRVFFAWMAMLLPLYLHQHLGFSWKDTGTILFFSLLPFVLFEAPLGFLTDRFNIVLPTVFCGFFILGGATAVLALETAPTLLLCISLLFISRIGASMVEIGTEAHFFRQVAASDEDAIMLFRATQPAGYIVGALLAGALFTFLSFPDLLLFFGCALSVGLAVSLFISPARMRRTSALSCRQSGLRC